MTLGFSTKWPKQMGELAGQPNYFIDKIWQGLTYTGSSHIHKPLMEMSQTEYSNMHIERFGKKWDMEELEPFSKLHTIREDPHNRWKPGMDIHMVINNRTKNRFQFSPVIPCIDKQPLQIEWINGTAWVSIGYRTFTTFRKTELGYEYGENAKELTRNDGFDSVEDFFAYFNKDFKGVLIHWTDLKY